MVRGFRLDCFSALGLCLRPRKNTTKTAYENDDLQTTGRSVPIACRMYWQCCRATGHECLIVRQRGYLALGVYVHHFILTWYWKAENAWGAAMQAFANDVGGFGVAVLFMISGFLFIRKIVFEEGCLDWSRLYRSRLFRIVPLYYYLCRSFESRSFWFRRQPTSLSKSPACIGESERARLLLEGMSLWMMSALGKQLRCPCCFRRVWADFSPAIYGWLFDLNRAISPPL